VDFILPYSYSDKKLGRLNVDGMFWQIKNDARFGAFPHPCLFDAMDPYKLGTSDEQDEDARVTHYSCRPSSPLLGNFLYNDIRSSKAKDPKEKAKGPDLAKQTKKGKGKQKAVSRPQRPRRSYTAYDFYCGGPTPAVWRLMTRDNCS
jgi:hypothetical protein